MASCSKRAPTEAPPAEHREAAQRYASPAADGGRTVQIEIGVDDESPENGSTNDEGLDFVGSRTDLHYFTSVGVSFAKPGNAYIIYLDSHAGSSQQTSGSPVIPFKLTIAPSPITLGTQTVTISGSLNDFDDVTGCDVTFTAALDLRVD